MPDHGLIIVLSAPSGAGKSTICHCLMKELPNVRYSLSYTTRPRRPGERNGVDYFFVDEPVFKRMARAGSFVEWACVHGQYYGTPHRQLRAVVRSGKDIVLDIDVQGGTRIKKLFPEAVLIFVRTPSLAVLEKRLRARKKDSDEVIRRRLKNARKELTFLPKYDYLVINDTLEKAVAQVRAVIQAEHRRTRRFKRLPKFS